MTKINNSTIIAPNPGDDAEKMNHWYTADGNAKCYSHTLKKYGIFFQNYTYIYHMIQQLYSWRSCIVEKLKLKLSSHRTLFTKLETTQISFNRSIVKPTSSHSYHELLLSNKINELLISITWMYLKEIMLSGKKRA